MFEHIYSASMIRKALGIYSKVKSYRKAALICGIGKSTIHRWWHSFHTLFIRSKVQKKKKKRKLKYPDLVQDIEHLFENSTSLKYMSIRFVQESLNMKKKPSTAWLSICMRKAKISRRRFARTRVCAKQPQQLQDHYKTFSQVLNDHDDDAIICLDETAFSNLGNAVYGYFPRGKIPITISIPRREKKSVLVAISSNGIISFDSQTKAYNRASFLAFLEKLVPLIPPTTKYVLMDNVSFHKSKDVAKLLNDHDLQPLFIPPYSPRCNPIEEVFALAKRYFRSYSPTESLETRLDNTMQELNLYKDLAPYFRHTRRHVQEVLCQQSEL
jgi:transposase